LAGSAIDNFPIPENEMRSCGRRRRRAAVRERARANKL